MRAKVSKPGKTAIPVLPLLALAGLALLAGLWAGLLRLGWQIPGRATALPADHGPLMVSGFLGALVALERVVAIRRWWMVGAPLLAGLGWIAGLALPGTRLGPLLIALGSLVMVAIFIYIIRRETQPHTLTMGAGALSWLVGNLFWLAGRPVYQVVLWWAAFLVLTVAGERLELSRVLRPTRRQQILFGGAAGVFLAGVLLSVWKLDPGARLAGLGMILLAAWLARFDLARRNLRHPIPLTRYIARCLYLGYLWLAVGGLIALAVGRQSAGGYYDALLHSVFIGFILSMIFGHAPIILPALTGALVPFHRIFYVQLALLHGSLALRIAGDLLGSAAARQWGGLLNEVAMLLFLGVTIGAVVAARRKT